VNLYTREYYELTKRALKPGGIVSQWIPLHSQAETHVYQHFRTFLDSFTYAMAWYPVRNELILIGSDQPINIDFNSIEQRLQNPVINKIMSDIDFGTAYSLLGSIWFLKNELEQLSSSESIISDNNPWLEFFLGDARQIAEDGRKRIIESRSSFEEVYEKITQSSYFLAKAQKVTFKKYWDNRLNNEYAKIHYSHGNALFTDGMIEEAISHYKMAVKLNPDFAAAHNNLGNALLKKGNTSEAISHFKMAIKLNSDLAAAHYNLGAALVKIGNTSEAILSYNKAIEIKPDFAAAQKNLETALLSMEIQDLF
jgi:tetratricopeptide (TPR) repeat protein